MRNISGNFPSGFGKILSYGMKRSKETEQDFPEKLKQTVNKENYAQFLKLKPLKVKPVYARVELEVGEEHFNIYEIAHGRVVFSVLDEAFELASNSHGTTAVALSMSINYPRPTKAGKKNYRRS